jgi:hypothetical protein
MCIHSFGDRTQCASLEIRLCDFETAEPAIDMQIRDRGFTHGGVLVPKALCRRFSVIGQGKSVEGDPRLSYVGVVGDNSNWLLRRAHNRTSPSITCLARHVT